MEDMTLGRFIFCYISILYTCDEVNKILVLANNNISLFFSLHTIFPYLFAYFMLYFFYIQPQIGIKALFFRDL